jgi:hypothetical protein
MQPPTAPPPDSLSFMPLIRIYRLLTPILKADSSSIGSEDRPIRALCASQQHDDPGVPGEGGRAGPGNDYLHHVHMYSMYKVHLCKVSRLKLDTLHTDVVQYV